MDNVTISLNETLAHLEIQYKKNEFTINKLKCEHELQLFIRMELWQKEEVCKQLLMLLLLMYIKYTI